MATAPKIPTRDPQIEALTLALQTSLASDDPESAAAIMDRIDRITSRRRQEERYAEKAEERAGRRSAAISRNIAREALATAKKRAISQGLKPMEATVTDADYQAALATVENRIARPLSASERGASRALTDARISTLQKAVSPPGSPPALPRSQRDLDFEANAPQPSRGFTGQNTYANTQGSFRVLPTPLLPQVRTINPVP